MKRFTASSLSRISRCGRKVRQRTTSGSLAYASKMRGASSLRGLRRSKRAVVTDSGGITRDSGIGNLGATARLEKILEKGRRFRRQNSARNLALMVQPGHLQKIDRAAGGAAARIGASED